MAVWDRILFINLHTCGYPDAEDAYVDHCDDSRSSDHDHLGTATVRHDDSYSVDDDLK